MLQTGISTCGAPADVFEAFFSALSAAGVQTAEISPPQGHYDETDLREVRRLSDRYGVRLWSFHLPFYPFEEIDISSLDPTLRKRSVDEIGERIRQAADAGIGVYVIHPSGEPIPDTERAERIKYAKESLSRLSRAAQECGGTLAVEDLPRTCRGRNSAEILELLTADPGLRVCFDTNHLLGEDQVDFVRNAGAKIVTLHVSDYDRTDERHWLPGEGVTDWHALSSALLAAGYSGPWMYEVHLGKDPSMPRPRDLAAADFVRNAREILEGLPITRIR